jgi:short-subunit dehydrogenase
LTDFTWRLAEAANYVHYVLDMAEGKIILITGASGGIGAALAELLAQRGDSVSLVARRKDALESVAARCGSKARAIIGDVT